MSVGILVPATEEELLFDFELKYGWAGGLLLWVGEKTIHFRLPPALDIAVRGPNQQEESNPNKTQPDKTKKTRLSFLLV